MTGKNTIPNWKETDRPREKLMQQGAATLSDAELLAILIGSGTPKQSAVELMQHILADCNNNLNTLGKRTFRELMAYKGIGEAKAVTLVAAAELGRRRQRSGREERPLLNSSQALYELLVHDMRDTPVEEAWVVFMNRRYELIKHSRISVGGMTETAVDVRVILKEALLCNAVTLALAHNHPSNNCMPSANDDALTQAVKNACHTLRIALVDHLIVCDGSYYSYADEGRL